MGDAERKRDDETNALLDALDEAIAWTDSFCAEEISIKEASQDGFICESSEISSATTPGKVAGLIREEQRELQGLKSLRSSTENAVSPFSGSWNLDLRDSVISAELACSAYASPSTTRWVRNCDGGPTWVPVRSWPVRNLDSEFAEVDLATGAREASVVLEVEQYRNNIVGDVENILPSPCRIKKATEGGPLATDAHGAKCSLNNCLHQPHYTSPDSPPLVTSFTSAAITPLSDAIEAAALAAALAESALGSS